ncbi:tautomerase family protein [Rhodopseudomonas boonkerdii]|uniref:tautomerase family protein n=1 Tax=Rhodopseudomonas boonkerdii TaxID=475937 RepID=UPI001E4CE5EA|nr:tautomerase family protein [Rhodopseudomonas boonkerdii]UGV28369.1 tautomerase family protein [Rhodopseudomonas boonkerdii]
MPLIRISLKKGTSQTHRAAIADGVYQALRETFNVPENDRFVTIHEHGDGDFIYDPTYFGIQRSDALVIIQATVSNTRSREQKQALYRRIVEKLTDRPGLRPEDIFINLVEVPPENWSFGHGVAQYVQ